MTDQPINLAQLRADIKADEGYGESWHLSPACVLALIDAAEAAEHLFTNGGSPSTWAKLGQALTKFTWTQP